ncbi:uncharacterized protein [Diadema antillarum]|uniref:uncharacterized protein n=1 Tax=Diadema antillarum TaxID=105358 RepID=UPI003A882E1F
MGRYYGVVSLRPSPYEDAPLTSVTLNEDEGTLNVSLLLYDSATGSPSVNGTEFIDEDVIISCNITTLYTPGDTIVSLTDILITASDVSGLVPFSVEEQGRPVEVQCRGETSPDSTGTTAYFNFETSGGPTGNVAVKKSPVVSFCEPVITVPNSPTITTADVQVELSELVVDFPVNISCAVTGVIDANGNSVSSDGNTSLILQFRNVTVQPGDSTEVYVPYTIERRGTIVQVSCYAASENGTQFLSSTSTGTSSSAVFSLDEGTVSLLPSVSDIKTTRISAFLVLGDRLTANEGTITYSCYVDQATSYEQGLRIAQNPACVTPDDVFIRPTPGPTTTGANPNATTANATTANLTTPTAAATTTTPQPVTTVPAPSTQGTTRRPTNDTSTPWILLQSEIVFEEGDIFKELVLTLHPATPTFAGAIVVTCCAPEDINTNRKYINTSDALVFYADVDGQRPINWTLASGPSSRTDETPLPNPAYVDLSPCPCDLTAGHCDVECCCDEDCNAADILVFSCADEVEEILTTIHDCNSTDLYKADWSPLLCVQTSNSPYLGMYQGTVPAQRDLSAFNQLKTASLTGRDTSYQDSGSRTLDYTSPDGSAYSNGDPVELLYGSGSRGFLALPQMVLSGECLWTSPVQFQEDLVTRCVLPPNQVLCQEFSPLSALLFLRSSTESYPPCPNQPLVVSQYGQASTAPTDIQYYCVEDVSEYQLQVTSEEDLFGLYQSSLFADTENGSLSESVVPQRCLWDDGFSQPPAPVFDNFTNLCLNSVVSVSYEMFWRGGEITWILGTVIMGSMPLIPDDSIIEEEAEEFVPPPVTVPVPASTAAPTTESDLSTDIIEGITFITEVEEILETAVTDVAINADQNSTDANVTTPAASTTSPPTTPVATTFTPFLSTPPPTVVTTDGMTTTNLTTTNTDNNTQADNFTTDAMPTTDMTTSAPITQSLSTPLNFTVRYATKFTYLPAPNITLSGVLVEPEEQYQRSGNPGYVIGKRVLSGEAVLVPLVLPTTPGTAVNCTEFPSAPSCVEIPLNETVFVFDSVDDSDSSQLKVFTPGDGSLCSLSSTTTLTFGQDTVSGCILRMGQSELENCTLLAAYMEAELKRLVPSNRIGKRGDSSTTVEEDWVEIFHPDTHPFDLPTDEPPTTSPLGEETTANSQTTEFPGQRYVDPEPPVNAQDQLSNVCRDVPTAVNLEVLITEAGMYSGVPQYEILSARVTYTTSTIQLTCSGALGASCIFAQPGPSENGTMVQSFPVYSTVTFTTVPAVEPTPVILYYKDYDPDLCQQDACLSELFYPLTASFEGDPFQYSLAVAMVLVIITTAYFLVTWPCAHL